MPSATDDTMEQSNLQLKGRLLHGIIEERKKVRKVYSWASSSSPLLEQF